MVDFAAFGRGLAVIIRLGHCRQLADEEAEDGRSGKQGPFHSIDPEIEVLVLCVRARFRQPATSRIFDQMA